MSRLAERLTALKGEGRKALTTFITAGDPDLHATVPALNCALDLVREGVLEKHGVELIGA